MKTKQTAAGTSGAGNLYVSASQISLLIEIAALAMEDDSCRQLTIKQAHFEYIEAIKDFEVAHGRVKGRIDPDNPDHAEIIAATKIQYDALQDALRKSYNLRRRLQTACRKAGRLNVERRQEVTQ